MHREIRASKTCPGSVDMGRLLAEASAASPGTGAPRRVMTIAKANLRRQAPSTSAPICSVIPTQTVLEPAGFTASGEPVNGNAYWYETPAHDYIWAGATDRPNPTAE